MRAKSQEEEENYSCETGRDPRKQARRCCVRHVKICEHVILARNGKEDVHSVQKHGKGYLESVDGVSQGKDWEWTEQKRNKRKPAEAEVTIAAAISFAWKQKETYDERQGTDTGQKAMSGQENIRMQRDSRRSICERSKNNVPQM